MKSIVPTPVYCKKCGKELSFLEATQYSLCRDCRPPSAEVESPASPAFQPQAAWGSRHKYEELPPLTASVPASTPRELGMKWYQALQYLLILWIIWEPISTIASIMEAAAANGVTVAELIAFYPPLSLLSLVILVGDVAFMLALYRKMK